MAVLSPRQQVTFDQAVCPLPVLCHSSFVFCRSSGTIHRSWLGAEWYTPVRVSARRPQHAHKLAAHHAECLRADSARNPQAWRREPINRRQLATSHAAMGLAEPDGRPVGPGRTGCGHGRGGGHCAGPIEPAGHRLQAQRFAHAQCVANRHGHEHRNATTAHRDRASDSDRDGVDDRIAHTNRAAAVTGSNANALLCHPGPADSHSNPSLTVGGALSHLLRWPRPDEHSAHRN